MNNVIDDVAKNVKNIFNKIIVFNIEIKASENELNLIKVIFITMMINITHAIRINFLI